MRMLLALLMFVLAGLNGYFSMADFTTGHLGSGAFSAVATVWCLALMIKYLVEED